MPCVVSIPSAIMKSGYVAAMQYRHSKRTIYAGANPHAAEFVEHPDHAARHHTEEAAAAAGIALIQAFEIRNRDAVELFTLYLP